MYKMLTEVCLELNPTKNSCDKDVGSSKYNRHQTTATTLLSSSEVKEVISIMKSDFSIYREKMTCSKRLVLRERLELFHDLQQRLIKSIPGIAQIRSMHLILISSLVGILPLEFYINVPMHHSGGPQTFLEKEMNYSNYDHCDRDKSKSAKLLTWTAVELNMLQILFTKNLTANMFENAACMISRGSKKVDVFYFMPWYNDLTSKLTPDTIQLCFCLKLLESNTWNLEAFDGKNSYCFLSTDPNRNTIVNFFMDKHTILEYGHMVDILTLRKIYH